MDPSSWPTVIEPATEMARDAIVDQDAVRASPSNSVPGLHISSVHSRGNNPTTCADAEGTASPSSSDVIEVPKASAVDMTSGGAPVSQATASDAQPLGCSKDEGPPSSVHAASSAQYTIGAAVPQRPVPSSSPLSPGGGAASPTAQPVVVRVTHSSDAHRIQYRMQLNTLAMRLHDLPQHLQRATQLVIAAYARDLQASLTASDPHNPAAAVATRPMEVLRPRNEQPPVHPSRIPFSDVPLVEVTFNHNNLTDDAMPTLVAFLSSNKNIRSFEILGNALTDACAPQLRCLLQGCPHLQRIKLADNQLSDAAAVAIGETIFEASIASSSARVAMTAVPSETSTLLPAGSSGEAIRGAGETDGDAAAGGDASCGETKGEKGATDAFPIPSKPRFLQLNIGGNAIGTRGIKALCEAALVSGMQILGLRGVALTPEGWGYCGALCAAYAHQQPQHQEMQQSNHVYDGDGEGGGGAEDNGQEPPSRRGSGSGRHGSCGTQRHPLSCHAVTELQLKLNPMTSVACMESFVQSAQTAAAVQVAHTASPQRNRCRDDSNTADTADGAPSTSPPHEAPVHPPPPFVYSTIASLTLACCAIDARMCVRLVSLLRTTLTTLEHLDLGHNNNIGDEGCKAIAEWLRCDCDAGGSNNRGGGAASFLVSLSLEFTGLSIAGLTFLAEAFSPTSSAAAPQVQSAGRRQRRIQVLNIGANVFGTAATPLLVQLLSSTPALEKLYVRGCHLGGPSHLLSLINQLLQLPKISDVDFTSNFSDEDGVHWERLIGASSTIRRLMLTDNNMPVAATTAIANALVRTPHRQLVVLQLGGKSKTEPLGNVVASPAHAAVLRSIQRNRQGATTAANHDVPTTSTSVLPSYYDPTHLPSTTHGSAGHRSHNTTTTTAAAGAAAGGISALSSSSNNAPNRGGVPGRVISPLYPPRHQSGPSSSSSIAARSRGRGGVVPEHRFQPAPTDQLTVSMPFVAVDRRRSSDASSNISLLNHSSVAGGGGTPTLGGSLATSWPAPPPSWLTPQSYPQHHHPLQANETQSWNGQGARTQAPTTISASPPSLLNFGGAPPPITLPSSAGSAFVASTTSSDSNPTPVSSASMAPPPTPFFQQQPHMMPSISSSPGWTSSPSLQHQQATFVPYHQPQQPQQYPSPWGGGSLNVHDEGAAKVVLGMHPHTGPIDAAYSHNTPPNPTTIVYAAAASPSPTFHNTTTSYSAPSMVHQQEHYHHQQSTSYSYHPQDLLHRHPQSNADRTPMPASEQTGGGVVYPAPPHHHPHHHLHHSAPSYQ